MPEGSWRWLNFSPAEITCRGTSKLLVNELALDKPQPLQDRLGKPLIVCSGYRSPEHNHAVGGATRSKHMDGAVGFLRFGFYPRSGFIHVDLGPARHWGGRFPIP